jgi:RNA polymerase sigma-70 factor (ECF subfamily)
VLYRRHVLARRRSVTREEVALDPLGRSAEQLAERHFARHSSPSTGLRRDEVRSRVRAPLPALPGRDREVLVLRHLEGLSSREAGAVLGVTEGAVNVRHLRALRRLRDLLGEDFWEGG